MQENFDEVLKKIVQKELTPARIVELKSEKAENMRMDIPSCESGLFTRPKTTGLILTRLRM